jgi:glycine betaine/proline transport system substrate-binding protein
MGHTQTRKVTGRFFATVALAASLAVGAGYPAARAQAEVPESNDPIRISLHDWTGSVFTSTLAARILGEMGYNVELIPIDASAVNSALESGDITLQTEAWTSVHPEVAGLLADGRYTNVGETGLMGMDRWWYPAYVGEQCPGLPDYKALNDCAALFATPETGDKGRLLLYSADWGGNDDERVASLGLNYEISRVGSEAALLAEVQSAVQRKAPILAWLYEPHWAPVKFDGRYVELPPYTEECSTSGRYDCEKPSGPILKLSWNGMADKWPAAFAAMQNFTMTNKEYGQVIQKVDLDGVPMDDVVDAWMADNKDRWSAWIAR